MVFGCCCVGHGLPPGQRITENACIFLLVFKLALQNQKLKTSGVALSYVVKELGFILLNCCIKLRLLLFTGYCCVLPPFPIILSVLGGGCGFYRLSTLFSGLSVFFSFFFPSKLVITR